MTSRSPRVIRGHEMARSARLDRRVGRLRLHERQPAGLQLGARAYEEPGIAGACDEAGSRLDPVRILQRSGRDVHLDPLGAELLRERAPFGLAREDVDGAVTRRDDEKQQKRD